MPSHVSLQKSLSWACISELWISYSYFSNWKYLVLSTFVLLVSAVLVSNSFTSFSWYSTLYFFQLLKLSFSLVACVTSMHGNMGNFNIVIFFFVLIVVHLVSFLSDMLKSSSAICGDTEKEHNKCFFYVLCIGI